MQAPTKYVTPVATRRHQCLAGLGSAPSSPLRACAPAQVEQLRSSVQGVEELDLSRIAQTTDLDAVAAVSMLSVHLLVYVGGLIR